MKTVRIEEAYPRNKEIMVQLIDEDQVVQVPVTLRVPDVEQVIELETNPDYEDRFIPENLQTQPKAPVLPPHGVVDGVPQISDEEKEKYDKEMKKHLEVMKEWNRKRRPYINLQMKYEIQYIKLFVVGPDGNTGFYPSAWGNDQFFKEELLYNIYALDRKMSVRQAQVQIEQLRKMRDEALEKQNKIVDDLISDFEKQNAGAANAGKQISE